MTRSLLRNIKKFILMMKLAPKKYGDSIETVHSGGITVYGWGDEKPKV